MKQAMKDKEAGKLKLSVIRMVRSAAKNVEIDRRKELDDNELLDVVAKEVKMRRDSLDEFRKAGRPELLAVLEQEIAILMEYLPEQMVNGKSGPWLRRRLLMHRRQALKTWGK